jgi:hypothetical protein
MSGAYSGQRTEIFAASGRKRRKGRRRSAEAFDQRPQAGFWHRWYKFVEHGSLAKQRMRALL